MEQKGIRTHGHGPQCGDCGGTGVVRGLNGNARKIKIKSKNKNKRKKDQVCKALGTVVCYLFR